MLLTEKQAQDKVCPMIAKENCRASGCMAWRWGYWQKNMYGPAPTDDVGYCGLAGQVYIAVGIRKNMQGWGRSSDVGE